VPTSTTSPKIEELRSLSQLFTNSAFRKIVREKKPAFFRSRVRKYAHLFPHLSAPSNGDLLATIYNGLTVGYRNEHVFKTSLVNHLLLKEYDLHSTSAFFELKVAKSVADLLIINGQERLFEIKTDLDSPDRLRSQLANYHRCTSHITVVTSEQLAEKYLSILADESVGLMVLTSNQALETVKTTQPDSTNLNHEALFKLLRKEEYSRLITQQSTPLPKVPNTKYFKACLSLCKQININTFQRLVFETLKQRKVKEPQLIESSTTPEELRSICIALNFSRSEFAYLHRFLSSPFARIRN